ncbi:MAG: hypothetical protein R2815_12730 [Flavobacteriales bacterium]
MAQEKRFSVLLLVAGILSLAPNIRDSIAVWDPVRQLHWTDYRGQVPVQTPHGAVTHLVVQSSNVFPDWRHVDYEVICHMVKEKSWVKPEHRRDSVLLRHEQVHFDLAECSARTLRKKLMEETMAIDECNSRLQVLRDSVHRELQKLQDKYDRETAHGVLVSEQARWARKVEHMLDSLSGYSQTRFRVALR